MKSFKQTFTITMPEKQGFMDLTDDIMSTIRNSGISDGVISVNAMSTTASVIVSKNDEAALQGYLKFYEKLATLAEEELRPALMHQLCGNGVTLPIVEREVALGFTQFIIYIDFDGEREKYVDISIVGE